MYNNFSEWVGLDDEDLVFHYYHEGQIKPLIYVKMSRDFKSTEIIYAFENEYAQLASIGGGYMPSFGGNTKAMGMFMKHQNESSNRNGGFYNVSIYTNPEFDVAIKLREYLSTVVNKDELAKTTSAGFIVNNMFNVYEKLPYEYEERAFRETEIYRYMKWSV